MTNTIRVTFDSNVWEIIASPEKLKEEASSADFNKIKQSIINKTVLGCLSETIFTLEAIKKGDRKDFLVSYRPEINITEDEQKNGFKKLSMIMAPNRTLHPGMGSQLASCYQNAMAIGIKLLRCSRAMMFINPDIDPSYFLADEFVPIQERQKRFADVGRIIENHSPDTGFQRIKTLGFKYDSLEWIKGIRNAPDSEEKRIVAAVAEWADGDSVAAHIAYGNTYFCTRDRGKGAGQDSILSDKNKEWLTKTYNIEFVSPEELAQIF